MAAACQKPTVNDATRGIVALDMRVVARSALDPWGRVLAEVAGVRLPDEEVTRDGHRVVRVWRYARGSDGAPYLWVGRRGGPAFETGASGLRFDLAVRS